ncbi:MAG: hypothetical protein C4518_03590 [Desulfobacteraceae bacterium]|nr:MAG: hypothetical protein C4518_03590 [Desulfobacteraceae bacterium]
MGKKSNKRTQPCAAENSLSRWFPWRGQKLAAKVACHWPVIPISFVGTASFIGIYPLKQFAPVIHENHQVRAASQWAKNTCQTIKFHMNNSLM